MVIVHHECFFNDFWMIEETIDEPSLDRWSETKDIKCQEKKRRGIRPPGTLQMVKKRWQNDFQWPVQWSHEALNPICRIQLAKSIKKYPLWGTTVLRLPNPFWNFSSEIRAAYKILRVIKTWWLFNHLSSRYFFIKKGIYQFCPSMHNLIRFQIHRQKV